MSTKPEVEVTALGRDWERKHVSLGAQLRLANSCGSGSAALAILDFLGLRPEGSHPYKFTISMLAGDLVGVTAEYHIEPEKLEAAMTAFLELLKGNKK